MAGSAVIGALRVNLGIDSAQFSDGLKKAQSSMSKFGGVLKAGAVAAAAGLGAAIGGMGLAMRGAINAADDMSKAAAKIGIPIEELSRLKYAADLSGISMETLSTGVKKLSVNMANGAKVFGQVGINVKNADGSLKSASAVMTELADKFAAMPDGAEKTAMAIKLFGKAGAEMIPLLNGGSAALAGLMKEADSFGQVFTAEMGKNAEAFNDNISRLQGAFGAIAANLAGKLLPTLVAFTDWLVANAPAVANFFVGLANGIGTLVSIGKAFYNFGFEMGQAIKQTVDTVIASWNSMISTIVSLKDAGVQAVSAMVTAITDYLQNKLNAVFATVGEKIEWVKQKFYGLYDAVVGHSYIPDMVDEIGTHMGRLDQEMVTPANEAIGQVRSAFSSWVGEAIDGTFNLQEALSGLAKQMLSMATDRAINALLGTLFGSGSAGGGYTNTLAFGGPRAMGGNVSPRNAYLVGEKGPEMFVPRSAGAIVPNSAMGGGGSQVFVNVENNNGSDVKTRGSGSKADPLRIIVSAVNSEIAKGGFDKSMGARYGANAQARQR